MKQTLQIFLTLTLLTCLYSPGYAQTLDSLYRLAVDNNPKLKALELEYKAELTKKDQVSQLPQPQLGTGIPILRPETRLGPQVVMLSASQMFPWFGTLDAKEELTVHIAKARYEELMAERLNVMYEIKTAYYGLNYLQKEIELIHENLDNYNALESIALAKVEAGNASLSEVLRIQSEIAAIEARLELIKLEQTTLNADINTLIKAPLDQEIEILDSIQYKSISLDFESTRLKLEQNHPLLQQLNYQFQASQSRVEVSQKMKQPTFGVGLDYSMVNPRIDANPANNGRDILVPRVMLSIPIYRKRHNAVISQESLTQEAINYRKESIVDDMLNKLIQFQANLNSARISLELKEDQLEKISSAYEILLAEYSANGNNMEALLKTQNNLIQLKLEREVSVLQMGVAQASIERITDF
ncbi:MAG: TolC family protein [Fluviicola sp.]